MNGRALTWEMVFLLLVSFCLLLPNFLPFGFFSGTAKKRDWEVFEPALADQLKSIAAVLSYTDSLAADKNIESNSLDYGLLLTTVIKKRFYHGFSHYSLNENWTAALAGKAVWYDLSAIVLPEDLLKYPMAACSQQGIVLIECLRRKGISYRKVMFDHHFAVEAYFDGWYFFDPNMEPDFTQVARTSLETLFNEKRFVELYKQAMSPSDIAVYLANPRYSDINGAIAKNASAFQKTTKVLSKTLWLLPLSFFLFAWYRRKAFPLRRMENNTSSTTSEKKIKQKIIFLK